MRLIRKGAEGCNNKGLSFRILLKGTVSRESLQKFKSARTHLPQRKPSAGIGLFSSGFLKNNNTIHTSAEKRSDIIMLAIGTRALSLKNSG